MSNINNILKKLNANNNVKLKANKLQLSKLSDIADKTQSLQDITITSQTEIFNYLAEFRGNINEFDNVLSQVSDVIRVLETSKSQLDVAVNIMAELGIPFNQDDLEISPQYQINKVIDTQSRVETAVVKYNDKMQIIEQLLNPYL